MNFIILEERLLKEEEEECQIEEQRQREEEERKRLEAEERKHLDTESIHYDNNRDNIVGRIQEHLMKLKEEHEV